MLETYTSLKGDDFHLPNFLDVEKEVTDDPAFSMYNLSRTENTTETTTSQEKLLSIVGKNESPSKLPPVKGVHSNIIMDNIKDATVLKQCMKKNGVKSNGLAIIKPGRPVSK